MFTGLIQDMGTVREARRGGGPLRLVIDCDTLRPQDLELGESVATSGICLTVVERTARGFAADAGQETLDVTTAGLWGTGTRVNLERSLRLGDRLGGHLVLGHVDGTGVVRGRREEAGVLQLEVSLPEAIAPLVCRKGSVALDGVSLTVNEASRDAFRVTLIPETVRRTNLGALKPGDRINIEADILARHLARMAGFGLAGGREGGGNVGLAFLSEHGYL